MKHFRSDAGHVRIVAAEGKVERAVGIEAHDGPSAGKVDFAVRRHLHVVQSIVDEIGLADDILSGLRKAEDSLIGKRRIELPLRIEPKDETEIVEIKTFVLASDKNLSARKNRDRVSHRVFEESVDAVGSEGLIELARSGKTRDGQLMMVT